ncbi:hypothetical protein N7508_008076, partial [Penicillium antarcticum]|uniref:uncharacterized protein n=1 Tax=Penicillium antarcticum TaxID=416450 RepID=UPI0023918C38
VSQAQHQPTIDLQLIVTLEDQCLHPLNQTPYIKSLRRGQDISSEGLQTVITISQRIRYHAFDQKIDHLIQKVQVIDFMDGVMIQKAL